MATKSEVASLIRQLVENQFDGDCEAFEAAYDALLEVEQLINHLAETVADPNSPYRVTAIDLLECFHSVLNSSAALPALRKAMSEDDPWLRLCAAEAIWIIDGGSPKDIAGDALEIIRKSAGSSLNRVRDRARQTLKMLKEVMEIG